jgi:AcrR family transcriptional regulator
MSAARDTADKILDATAELIAQHGYAGTTTRAIAERAGVNEVTVFRRFGNKLGVVRALGERFSAASPAAAMRELPDPEDVHGTLLAIARNEIAGSVEYGGVALRLAFDARSVPEIAELMGEGPARNLEALAGYMADRQRAGALRDDIDAEVLAEAFATLTSSYVMYRMVMGFIDEPADGMSDERVEQLVDVFWSGAAPSKGRRQ